MTPLPEPGHAACVLAFDTSTEMLALALQAPSGVFTAVAAGGAQASARLLPQARRLLDRAGIAWQALDAIAFGRGPGAFTGLRTSCAVAQGLGLGLGRPLLAIDSLLIVAEDARAQQASSTADLDIAVAMDARMDEVYAARYRHAARDGRWHTLAAPALHSLPSLAQAWGGVAADAVAGSACAAFGARLPVWPGAARIERESDRPAALLRLALAAWRDGEAVDPAQALPVYVRDRVALKTHEREAARRAAGASES